MFDDPTRKTITRLALDADLEPAVLLAVCDVESGGRVFATVKGRPEPLIRFEGHYFDRRLTGEKRQTARRKGLAAPAAGQIANPKTQPARWRMLERAAAIDRKSAYESTSWGLGQVMGAHWAWLGFASVDALVEEARSGADGQVRLMLRFIGKAKLIDPLRNRDWAGFARGYNGPGYRRNRYDTQMKRAYARYRRAGHRPTPEPSEPQNRSLLQFGMRGQAVADLQNLLIARGYHVVSDGIFGPATLRQLSRYQADHGLVADGIAGTKTMESLTTHQVSLPSLFALMRRIANWLGLPSAR